MKIKITTKNAEALAELKNTKTAEAVNKALPLNLRRTAEAKRFILISLLS
jgi:hypothetical protein